MKDIELPDVEQRRERTVTWHGVGGNWRAIGKDLGHRRLAGRMPRLQGGGQFADNAVFIACQFSAKSSLEYVLETIRPRDTFLQLFGAYYETYYCEKR